MKKAETGNPRSREQNTRKAALGQALKANLGRRKAQARARKSETGKKENE